jgi:DNA (cytosine-5)-methyltransferase 1
MARNEETEGQRPVAIDLFCGAGGMSVGFEQAGFDVVLSVEADGHHAAVHARNFPDAVTLCTSVVGLTADDLHEALGREIHADLVFGGPPCQGFSHMGLRDSQDPRNTLVDEFARLVAELRPRAFVMENVPGLLSGDTKAILDRTVAFLDEAGYRITTPVCLLDASKFGVPQQRKRLFLLGVREDVSGWFLQYPDGPCPGQPPKPTVWQAISDLPRVDERDELFGRDETPYDRRPESEYAMVARGVLQDPSDHSRPRQWRSDVCTGCLRIKHTDKAVQLYAATPAGETVPGHKLPRLDPQGICPTLRAGSDSAHGSYTAPRPIHPFEPRCITAREAARLHGFPDWFSFYPLKWHAYRQIGNAVCPPVVRAVGRKILEVLGRRPMKPSVPLLLRDEFKLPEDRPRTLKRIPHVENYPAVVRHLFERAYDAETGVLQRPRFTFGDVRAAIEATGVNLSWTRADTFVSEIARSRNLRQILAPCLAHGYSIRAFSDPEFIGEFVPAGDPGTVEDKDALQVKSQDIAGAISLDLSVPSRSSDPCALAAVLGEEEVVATLWGRRKVRVEVDPPARINGLGLMAQYRLCNGNGDEAQGLLVVPPQGTLPTRTRIGRLAEGAGVAEVVLVAALTSRHILMARFECCLELPREVSRQVYELPPSPNEERP